MFKLKGKRVLVMGLGVLGGGRAVAKWLLKQGVIVTITDLRSTSQLRDSLNELRQENIVWHLGGHRKKDFLDNDFIVQNPAVPRESPYLKIARQHKIPIYNEAGIFFLLAKRPIIGITGTRGKSTVSYLLYNILKNKYKDVILAGNIGTSPMFSVIKKASKSGRSPIVLELSSWQVEGLVAVKKSPAMAILTNLYPDHLNRYASRVSYYKAKQAIFKFQSEKDVSIFNYDNSQCRQMANQTRAKVYWFSANSALKNCHGTYLDKGIIYFKNLDKIDRVMSMADFTLPGKHNLSNLLAAITAARLYGVSSPLIRRAVLSVNTLWGRQQLVAVKKGISFYNDTTATTPEAVMACLASCRPPIVLIAGGEDKNLSYKQLARLINKKAAAIVLLPGSASQLLLWELERIKNPSVIIKTARSLPAAVKISLGLAAKGSSIVLSPAAASFNLFRNEFDRGEQFIDLVKKI